MANYPDPQSQVPRAAPNSSMAIICLVAGILGLTFFPIIGSIIALITGPMAKREIAQSMGRLSGEGLAQAGVVLGWIGVALTVIGVCVGGAFLVLPLCLLALGFGVDSWGFLLPLVIAVF